MAGLASPVRPLLSGRRAGTVERAGGGRDGLRAASGSHIL
ncbi:hypothetical protein HMPREF9141_1950 [Prevotella multiformis DSM 16608]|uniref:Uncharacterized protein n=1 Tax=Prevotella multiformis DSM 16608 TaxID=888743 RepID=F0F8N3_9BACT|nr:hypothetical protein HMPREF9141_1950 [Prevotella multiformis DSM 16608]